MVKGDEVKYEKVSNVGVTVLDHEVGTTDILRLHTPYTTQDIVRTNLQQNVPRC